MRFFFWFVYFVFVLFCVFSVLLLLVVVVFFVCGCVWDGCVCVCVCLTLDGYFFLFAFALFCFVLFFPSTEVSRLSRSQYEYQHLSSMNEEFICKNRQAPSRG